MVGVGKMVKPPDCDSGDIASSTLVVYPTIPLIKVLKTHAEL